MRTSWTLILIGLGGACGSILRYLMSGWVQRLSESHFPAGTLAVNVVGCFVIGVLNIVLFGPLLMREEYRLAILVGVLGGFTTFSSFGWETISLLNDGQWALAGTNVILSNGLGLAAAWLGYRLAQWWFGAGA